MKAAPFAGCRGILFDFGGTLDGDGEHWLDRFYTLYEDAGLPIARPRIKEAFYSADAHCTGNANLYEWGLAPLMERHVEVQFSVLQLDDSYRQRLLADGFTQYSRRFLSRNRPLLQELKSRFRLGVVSNFYGNVAALCREAGLAESLQVIVDSARLGVSKPAPGIFLAALDGLDLLPEEVVFIGDSYARDMVPARALGMKTVWLRVPAATTVPEPGVVDACINSLTELSGLFA